MSDLQLLALALDPRTKDLLMVDQEIKTKTWKTLTNYALEVNRHQESHVEMKTRDRFMRFVSTQSFQHSVEQEVALWQSQKSIPPRTIISENPLVYQYPDVLGFWKTHSHLFPILAPIARKVLAVPATSVPSERVGSVAGNITRARRSRLSPDLIDDLTFGAMNWKFLTKRDHVEIFRSRVEEKNEVSREEKKMEDEEESEDESESSSEDELQSLSEESDEGEN